MQRFNNRQNVAGWIWRGPTFPNDLEYVCTRSASPFARQNIPDIAGKFVPNKVFWCNFSQVHGNMLVEHGRWVESIEVRTRFYKTCSVNLIAERKAIRIWSYPVSRWSTFSMVGNIHWKTRDKTVTVNDLRENECIHTALLQMQTWKSQSRRGLREGKVG